MVFRKQKDEQKSLLNPFTLSFRERKVNELYRNDYTCRSLSFARTSLFLAIGLFLVFSVLDNYIMTPAAAEKIMIFRLLGVVYFIIGIAFSYYKKIQKYYQLLMMTIILAGGGNIIFMIIVSQNSGGYFYYAGLILTIIYAHSLLRLRFIAAAFSTWILIIAYEISAISYATPEKILINNTFFLVSANLLGMFSSYGIEYFMKMAFWRNLMLQEKSTLLEVEHRRKSKELEDARLIQLSMIPKDIPEHPLYDIAFTMKTASEVGGDFYDLIIAEDGTITFAVGDATGHGAKAGAMVTAMKFLFSNYAKDMDIVDFMRKADYSLKQMRLPRLYMTFVIGRIKDDTIEVCGVGMPAITMHNHTANKLCKLSLKGFPLGSQHNFEYKKHTSTISDNDVLLVMTDGLPELFNNNRDTIGYEKVENTFRKSVSLNSQKILEKLLDMADEWKEEFPLQDDITLLIIKRKKYKSEELLPEIINNDTSTEDITRIVYETK